MIFAGSFRGAEGYFSAPLKYLNIVFVASGDRLSPIRTVDSLFSHQPLNVLVELVIGFGMITFENSKATVDMNVVMTGSGEFIEIQGTGEERPYTRIELNSMLEKAEKGINELIDYQKDVLGELAWKVGREP